MTRCGRKEPSGPIKTSWPTSIDGRPHFRESGILYRGRVTQYFFGVAGGVDQSLVPPQFTALGIEGGDQFEYTGNSQHDFLLDLEKFGGCPRSKFLISLENIWGRYGNVSLETGASAPTIFNALMPVDPVANGVPRLTNFVFVQPLSERFIISVGKNRLAAIADNNIFAGGDGSDQFLNQIFCANPLFVGQLPLTTFAVTAVMPRKWGNISLSLIDPLERSTEYFRFDDLFSEGMMLFGQIKVNTNFFRKPGEHHVGAYYKNVDLLDLAFSPIPPTYPYPPAPPGTAKLLTRPESYTIFYGFDQYVEVFEGRSSNMRVSQKGWGIFGRAGISDDATGNPNFSAWHISCGIGGNSPLRQRRDTRDRFGIGYGYTGSSNAWGPPARLLLAPGTARPSRATISITSHPRSVSRETFSGCGETWAG